MTSAATRQRLSNEEFAVWSSFIRVSQLLPVVLDAALRATGSSLPRYELLAVLARFPGGRRMSELGDLALVSKPRMTVHVAELVAEKLAARSVDPADARATIITLTAAGRRHLARQNPAHLALARALVLDHVAPISAELTVVLEQIRLALGDTLPPSGAAVAARTSSTRPRK
jgi:DNA-binding MarR family transcriptional regulator